MKITVETRLELLPWDGRSTMVKAFCSVGCERKGNRTKTLDSCHDAVLDWTDGQAIESPYQVNGLIFVIRETLVNPIEYEAVIQSVRISSHRAHILYLGKSKLLSKGLSGDPSKCD